MYICVSVAVDASMVFVVAAAHGTKFFRFLSCSQRKQHRNPSNFNLLTLGSATTYFNCLSAIKPQDISIDLKGARMNSSFACVYRFSEQRYRSLAELGKTVLNGIEFGQTLQDRVNEFRGRTTEHPQFKKFIGRRGKPFSGEDECLDFLNRHLTLFSSVEQLEFVLPLEFAGALHEETELATVHPYLAKIGECLRICLLNRVERVENEAAVGQLSGWLQAWDHEATVRVKTSGKSFEPWQQTLRVARALVKQSLERHVKRRRVEDFVNGASWRRPLRFDVLSRAFQSLWGKEPQTAIPLLSSGYLKLRVALRLFQHNGEVDPRKFCLNEVEVDGDAGHWALQRKLLSTENTRKQYVVNGAILPLRVSALSTCLLLNLHDLSPLFDPVQLEVAKNLTSVDATGAFEDYIRSAMRAVMFIHTTRRYEYSSCVIGCKLLEEADLLALLGRQHLCSESLRRRLTSEGRIPLGQSSVVAVMLGRSNILGTLPGREYHDVFEQCVGFVIDAFDEHRQPRPEITDNIVLDKVWASMRCIAGFGAARNVGEDDGASRCKDRLGGFILKNIVYQGLRMLLMQLGVPWGSSQTLMAGPNPIKLLQLMCGGEGILREHAAQLWGAVLQDCSGCTVSYRGRSARVDGLDFPAVQDNLCKVTEMLQSTTTGRLFGKGRQKALRALGVEVGGNSGSEEESEDA